MCQERINLISFALLLLALQCESVPSSRGLLRPKFGGGRGSSNPFSWIPPYSDSSSDCHHYDNPFDSGATYKITVTADDTHGCPRPQVFLNGKVLEDELPDNSFFYEHTLALYDGDILGVERSAQSDGNFVKECTWVEISIHRSGGSWDDYVYVSSDTDAIRAEYQNFVNGNEWLSPDYDGCGWAVAQDSPNGPDCFDSWAVPYYGEGHETVLFRLVMNHIC